MERFSKTLLEWTDCIFFSSSEGQNIHFQNISVYCLRHDYALFLMGKAGVGLVIDRVKQKGRSERDLMKTDTNCKPFQTELQPYSRSVLLFLSY